MSTPFSGEVRTPDELPEQESIDAAEYMTFGIKTLKKIKFSSLITLLKEKLGVNELNRNMNALDVLREWAVIKAGDTYNMTKPLTGYNYIFILHSCLPDGSVCSSTLLPVVAVSSSPANGIGISSYISAAQGVVAQIGFPTPSKFACAYVNSNVPTYPDMYCRVYGIY